MNNFSQIKTINRKTVYKSQIHSRDFFIIRRLHNFLYTQIPQLIKPGMKVADIGCGGQPLRNLIESCGGDYMGIDIIQNSENTVDILADIHNISFPSESFELIVCTDVLEHCNEPIKALKELYRLLKPGGNLLLTTPFSYALHEEPYDFYRYTPFFYQFWLPKLGFNPPKLLEKAGNELEAFAVSWDVIWRQRKNTPLLLRLILAIPRVTMNLIVLLIVQLFDYFLSKKNFLHILCVVDKPLNNSR